MRFNKGLHKGKVLRVPRALGNDVAKNRASHKGKITDQIKDLVANKFIAKTKSTII